MDNKSISFLIIFDILFILLILSFIILAIIDVDKVSTLVPAILILVGLALIGSKKLRELFYVERFFYWLSYNVFVPRMKSNHLIWGLFSIILGIFLSFRMRMERNAVYEGIIDSDPAIRNVQEGWYKDPMLWIVILLLIAIAFYRSKKKIDEKKKDSLK